MLMYGSVPELSINIHLCIYALSTNKTEEVKIISSVVLKI